MLAVVKKGALVDVPDGPRTVPAARAAVVEDLDVGQVVDEPTRLPGPPAQVGVLEVHEETLGHRADLRQGSAPNSHARPGDPGDRRGTCELLSRGEETPHQQTVREGRG